MAKLILARKRESLYRRKLLFAQYPANFLCTAILSEFLDVWIFFRGIVREESDVRIRLSLEENDSRARREWFFMLRRFLLESTFFCQSILRVIHVGSSPFVLASFFVVVFSNTEYCIENTFYPIDFTFVVSWYFYYPNH